MLCAPSIQIHPLQDFSRLDEALQKLNRYDWICFTSVNGVSAFVQRVKSLGLDGRALSGVKIAAIGTATAAALEENFLRADLLPDSFTGKTLAEAMIARGGDLTGQRVLLARADIGRDELPEVLKEAGAIVDDVAVYRTVRPQKLPDEVLEKLNGGRVDWITFTSSSTVENFLALLAEQSAMAGDLPRKKNGAKHLLAKAKLASIGPTTSQTLRGAGLQETVQAEAYTVQGLIDAILSARQVAR